MEKTPPVKVVKQYRWLVAAVSLLLYVVSGQMMQSITHPLFSETSLRLNIVIPVLVGYWCGVLPGALVGAFGPLLSFLLTLILGQPDFYQVVNVLPYAIMAAATGWKEGHETRLGASLTILIGHLLSVLGYTLAGLIPFSLLGESSLWMGLLAEVMLNLLIVMLCLGVMEQSLVSGTKWPFYKMELGNFLLLLGCNLVLLIVVLAAFLYGVPYTDYFLVLPIVVSALTLGYLESWIFALMISGFLGRVIISQGVMAVPREVALILVLNAVALALGDVVSNLRRQRRLAELRLEEIQQAYAVLSEADSLKEQMIQNVSHELRTPLSIMLGYTELLTSGAWGNLTPAQAEATQVIRRNARQLSEIVEKVTVLDSVDDGVITHHPTSLASLAKISIHARQQDENLNNYHFDLRVEGDIPSLYGDARYLSLSIEALLDNAVKFSPEGGGIISHLWCDDGKVYYAVADQGIGISKEEQKHLFECFYQVDGSSRRRFGGLGTGLALVKEVVRAHGGDVWVESAMGKGSTFGFWIPIRFDPSRCYESVLSASQSN